MARNNLMMQIQADVLGVSCVRPTVLETTALGAAFLAGLGVGFWSDTNAIKDAWCLDTIFAAQLADGGVQKLLSSWQDAINRA